MVEFEIRINKGPWNLEKILTFANQFRTMKCTYEQSWDKEAYSINKEDGSSIWYNCCSISIAHPPLDGGYTFDFFYLKSISPPPSQHHKKLIYRKS